MEEGDGRSSDGDRWTHAVAGSECLSSGRNEQGGIDQSPAFGFPVIVNCLTYC